VALAGPSGAVVAGAVSGAATALAFPPYDLGPVAFVSLIPLVAVFRGATRRRVAPAAVGFGLVFFGMLFPWIHLFGLAAYLLLVVLETLLVAAALVAGAWLRPRLPAGFAVLAFPAAFLAGEFVRSHWPLGGFPWGGLGYSQHNDLLVLRLAAYTGVWGVSFLVATVNAILAEAVVVLRADPVGFVARLALCILVVVAPALLPVTAPKGAAATVGIVQRPPPLPSAAPGSAQQQSLASEVALTRTLVGRPTGSKVDLVVWPESSFDEDPLNVPALSGPLLASIRETGASFVVGASVDAPGGRFRNESLFIRPDGSLAGRYVKMHLVPFGEYVPGRRLLAGWIHELDKVPLDGVAGNAPVIFSLPQGTFGSVICYETAYPELVGAFVARGARMIVVSTNNASYRRSAASAQMVALSQLRAAEQRMWVVQAALTGISAVIAPTGKVLTQTGLFSTGVLTPTVAFATSRTLYGRLGDWFPAAVLVAAAGAWAAGAAGAHRAKGAARAA
jgi:apolipoprotein N-acyltransferase